MVGHFFSVRHFTPGQKKKNPGRAAVQAEGAPHWIRGGGLTHLPPSLPLCPTLGLIQPCGRVLARRAAEVLAREVRAKRSRSQPPAAAAAAVRRHVAQQYGAEPRWVGRAGVFVSANPCFCWWYHVSEAGRFFFLQASQGIDLWTS